MTAARESAPLYQVDAFADRAYAGNPAAVCVLESAADADWMQAVGAEMNLSETAFLWPEDAGYRLRWFSPFREVDLCGHATLASAHVLWETGRSEAAQIDFLTRSGTLRAARRDEAIALDFPATPATPVEPPPGLREALGVTAAWVGRTEQGDYLVEVEREETVRDLAPDFRRLAAIRARGTIVTARAPAESEHDFVSRFFVPRYGIDEDPVTGSAHCALAPYWAPRIGRDDVIGYQASRRGGTVRARVMGDRVELLGSAVTVFEGRLLVGPARDGNGRSVE